MPTRSGGAVVWRTCAPDVTLTPSASAQQSEEIAGSVPVGAAFEPTVVHVDVFVPCRIASALSSSGTVGGSSGSSCARRRLTSDVYGAPGSTGGELAGLGSATGTR